MCFECFATQLLLPNDIGPLASGRYLADVYADCGLAYSELRSFVQCWQVPNSFALEFLFRCLCGEKHIFSEKVSFNPSVNTWTNLPVIGGRPGLHVDLSRLFPMEWLQNPHPFSSEFSISCSCRKYLKSIWNDYQWSIQFWRGKASGEVQSNLNRQFLPFCF